MPRYFFNIFHNHTHIDTVGEEWISGLDGGDACHGRHHQRPQRRIEAWPRLAHGSDGRVPKSRCEGSQRFDGKGASLVQIPPAFRQFFPVTTAFMQYSNRSCFE